MKKLLLTTLGLACAGSVFAQGTVQLNNHFSGGFSYVWSGPNTRVQGGDTADTPAGAYNYTANGFTKISAAAGTWWGAYLAANGSGVAESSLSFGANPTTTTFRSGAAAGIMALQTATLSNVPKDAAVATLELFVWNNSSGLYNNPVNALAAWQAGTIAGGTSAAFDVTLVGGDINTAPTPGGLRSFSVYTVPEPATMALAGLGAAAMLIFRRRK